MPRDGSYKQLPNDELVSDKDSTPDEAFMLPSWFIRPSLTTFISAVFYFSTLLTVVWVLWGIYNWNIGPNVEATSIFAKTRNGTYSGLYVSGYDQYQFLGMSYALPPVGNLRFRFPQALNESWRGVRNATSYSPICRGYRGHPQWFPQSENCLTINVITPAHVEDQVPLPVVVFIYGGGSHGGGSMDSRYNMSFLNNHAAKHGIPFISVSFNYRSSIWGFINSQEVVGSRNLNIGLRDQRMALHWVQENIGGFGGDPQRVTLMRGSSGADAIGLHLIAFGGRDDGLFRAAIMQSGGAVTAFISKDLPSQASYDRLVSRTSCSGALDSLDCLRHLPFEELEAAFDRQGENSSSEVDIDMASHSYPVIDGEFIQTFGSLSLKESKFVKVPILTGVNSNEGFTFISPYLKNWEDIVRFDPLRNLAQPVVEKLLSFYPDSPSTEPLSPPILGITDLATYNRVERLLGDIEYNAGKRLQCDAYAQDAVCYSYRFDAYQSFDTGNPHEGVVHGAEIVSVFQNFEGLGIEQNTNVLAGRKQEYFEMSRMIGLMWASFIVHLDPNTAFATEVWPKYSQEQPRSIVFNETGPFWMESDTWRRDATDYINSIQHGVFFA